jgi:hypothetical protein
MMYYWSATADFPQESRNETGCTTTTRGNSLPVSVVVLSNLNHNGMDDGVLQELFWNVRTKHHLHIPILPLKKNHQNNKKRAANNNPIDFFSIVKPHIVIVRLALFFAPASSRWCYFSPYSKVYLVHINEFGGLMKWMKSNNRFCRLGSVRVRHVRYTASNGATARLPWAITIDGTRFIDGPALPVLEVGKGAERQGRWATTFAYCC